MSCRFVGLSLFVVPLKSSFAKRNTPPHEGEAKTQWNMLVHMHTYKYTQHTHNTHTQTHNTQMRTHTHTHTHTHTPHTHTHTHTHTKAHTQHTHTHTHAHTHTHTHTHTQKSTHTHTHTHLHMCYVPIHRADPPYGCCASLHWSLPGGPANTEPDLLLALQPTGCIFGEILFGDHTTVQPKACNSLARHTLQGEKGGIFSMIMQ